MTNKIKRIALIQVTRPFVARPEIGLGTGYLKAYIEHRWPGRFSIDIFDSTDAYNVVLANVESYDFVGLSSVTQLYGVAIDIAKKLKEAKPSIVINIGGAHITAIPESLDLAFDTAVLGEGEISFSDLVDAEDRGLSRSEILSIPGIAGRNEDGSLSMGPKRKYISNLDDIPFPIRDIFNKYRAVPSLITSRGCPYDCEFCTNRIMWTRSVRRPQPKRVVDEICHLMEHVEDIRVIVFRDDILFLTTEYLKRVVSHAMKYAPQVIEIPKVIYSHVNVMQDPEFVMLLQEFGVVKALCGFESASERILKILKSGRVTTEQNQKAIDVCHSLGMEIGGNLIIGTPYEDRQDLIASYEFASKNVQDGKVGAFSTSILTPFPGSKYWDSFVGPDFDPLNFNWGCLDELAFSTYWQDTKGGGHIEDWWKKRNEQGNPYLGKLPEYEFLQLVDKYEPPLLAAQEEYLRKDKKY
ncbi:B12-binding domain-containing radical SAM protein [Desulfovibrio sp. JC010]|uniref:B12-binding domain-containing radical SAM protein n=1 Tax=Desulfovibrio sp. JC010 TaxID=2593641 RepID=UPI0013D48704|nr:radical SAM protein [Desulfovibrio sp. JC010]NDV26712.1 radical SAM protein [Desulfovibrio sp. JC010]